MKLGRMKAGRCKFRAQDAKAATWDSQKCICPKFWRGVCGRFERRSSSVLRHDPIRLQFPAPAAPKVGGHFGAQSEHFVPQRLKTWDEKEAGCFSFLLQANQRGKKKKAGFVTSHSSLHCFRCLRRNSLEYERIQLELKHFLPPEKPDSAHVRHSHTLGAQAYSLKKRKKKIREMRKLNEHFVL